MNQPSSHSSFSKLSLRRLWPSVSEKLYPNTAKKVEEVIAEVKKLSVEKDVETEKAGLLEVLNEVMRLLDRHYAVLSDATTNRLKTYPYGNEKIAIDYFDSSCQMLAVSAADLKTTWERVRIRARDFLAAKNSSSQQKLVLARLNSVEQDILYLLFVDLQYVRPLILKSTDV